MPTRTNNANKTAKGKARAKRPSFPTKRSLPRRSIPQRPRTNQRSVGIPANVSAVTRFNAGPVTTRVSGTDHFRMVVVHSDTAPGALVGQWPINRTNMIETRLGGHMMLYDKWRINRMKFTATTMAPSTTSNGYYMAWDATPDEHYPHASFAKMVANPSSVKASFSSGMVPAVVAAPATKIDLFCQDELKEPLLTTHGQVVVMVTGPPNVSTDITIDITVEYDVVFSRPNLEVLTASSQAYVGTGSKFYVHNWGGQACITEGMVTASKVNCPARMIGKVLQMTQVMESGYEVVTADKDVSVTRPYGIVTAAKHMMVFSTETAAQGYLTGTYESTKASSGWNYFLPSFTTVGQSLLLAEN